MGCKIKHKLLKHLIYSEQIVVYASAGVSFSCF